MYINFSHIQIILPINEQDHYILVVISIKMKLIITCDSIKNNGLPDELLEDIECMLDYLYPSNKGQWTHDVIRPEEQIQNGTTHIDCGFHILNFAEAALEDRLIKTDHADFNMFKQKIELQLETIKNGERQKVLNNQNQTNARLGIINTNNAILTLENSDHNINSTLENVDHNTINTRQALDD
jgi:Ulp1 protease family, C-terminal catalytic domain